MEYGKCAECDVDTTFYCPSCKVFLCAADNVGHHDWKCCDQCNVVQCIEYFGNDFPGAPDTCFRCCALGLLTKATKASETLESMVEFREEFEARMSLVTEKSEKAETSETTFHPNTTYQPNTTDTCSTNGLF